MAMRIRTLATLAVAAGAVPAAAALRQTVPARTDSGGMHYCASKTAPSYLLRANAKGLFEATYYSRVTAPLTAIAPAGAQSLFRGSDGFQPVVNLIYSITLDASGTIVAEQPYSISVTMGQLAAQEPISALTLELVTAKARTPVPLDADDFAHMALVRGSLHPEGLPATIAKPGSGVPMMDLMRAVIAVKFGAPTLILKRNGAAIATATLPRPNFDADRAAAVAWMTAAAPLLAKGQCG